MLGYVTSADRHLVLHIQIEEPAGINVAVYHKGCFSSLYGCSMLLLLDVDSRYLLHHHLKVVKCVFLLLLLKWIHSFQSCLAAS